MEEDLDVDIVIYGSGLVSVLTASVLSSQGLRIVLIDTNSDYGSNYRTLSLKTYTNSFLNAFDSQKKNFFFDPFGSGAKEDNDITNLNDYHIDLFPKMLYSLSPAVTSLLAFGCDNYVQFTSVEGSYICKDGVFSKIPASKSGVFRSEHFTPLQKRSLTRFLDNLEKTEKFLLPEEPQEKSLFSLNEVIKYGICRYSDGDEEVDLLQRAKMYIKSIGVYNRFSSPFIFPLYGTSDIVQAFARAASLLGCLFMLRTKIRNVHLNDSTLKMTVDTHGMYEDSAKLKTTKINCNLLLTETYFDITTTGDSNMCLSESLVSKKSKWDGHQIIIPTFEEHVAVVISSEKLLEEGMSTCVLVGNPQSYLLQLDSTSLTVSAGQYIYYITGSVICPGDVLGCPHIIKFKSLFEKTGKPLSSILFVSHHVISKNSEDSNLYNKGLNMTMVDEIPIVIGVINKIIANLKAEKSTLSQSLKSLPIGDILAYKDDLISQNKFINDLNISDSVIYKNQVVLDNLSSLVDKFEVYTKNIDNDM